MRLDDDRTEHPADLAAASALAAHLRRWALQQSTAAAADADAVSAAGHALVLARARGHVCLGGAVLRPWLPALRRSPLVAATPGGPAPAGLQPLVLALDADAPRLYLRRDHALETTLACRLAERARSGRLRLLSGGPGSGKTTRVAALLHERRRERSDLRIGLAAPTGKAAARMNEALGQAGAATALRATTVHRLLGARGPGAASVHGEARPLALDLLVVDEASMLDLELAAALEAALPAQAELLLVGDADQLAAVEAGAVFAQLCAFPWPDGLAPLHERLSGSRRYAADSPIAALAQALRSGDRDAARRAGQALMPQPARVGPGPAGSDSQLDTALAAVCAPYAELLRSGSAAPAELLAALRGVLVLAARHEGRHGTLDLNRRIVRLLQPSATAGGNPDEPWPGRAVIVLRNDPATRLANGHVGVLWPRSSAQPGSGGWDAWFAADPQPRAVAFERLPAHATAFALTVHKAQGSEADRVLVLLPPPERTQREWLYTAITRARRHLVLLGDPEALAEAAHRPEPRDSGLTQRLSGALGLGPSPHE
jgi:exodeoxyribonuclease V alpha subunit